ncbi:hypothetical protein ABT354_25280 [Streptomyces sp. NPDC000594]|uniref:hypothetical protein n=1 Tax=Streptomyces sp. NPDC000594 TaxID=3154261 RepID=UPI0033293D1A
MGDIAPQRAGPIATIGFAPDSRRPTVRPEPPRAEAELLEDWGPTVFPYRGKPRTGDTLHSAIITSDCEIVDRAKGICDFEQWLYIDPRNLDFGNEDAGTWKTAARPGRHQQRSSAHDSPAITALRRRPGVRACR